MDAARLKDVHDYCELALSLVVHSLFLLSALQDRYVDVGLLTSVSKARASTKLRLWQVCIYFLNLRYVLRKWPSGLIRTEVRES